MPNDFEHLFQTGADTTDYVLLTSDYVQTIPFEGKEVLKVDPKGLSYLSEVATREISFKLRSSHLKQVSEIFNDPKATSNDRRIAATLIQNACVAVHGVLPLCQDTGTSIVFAKKGQNIWTDVDDSKYLTEGIYNCFKNENLR